MRDVLENLDQTLGREHSRLCLAETTLESRPNWPREARQLMDSAVARILDDLEQRGVKARMSQTSSMRRGRPSRDGRAVRPRHRSRPKQSSRPALNARRSTVRLLHASGDTAMASCEQSAAYNERADRPDPRGPHAKKCSPLSNGSTPGAYL